VLGDADRDAGGPQLLDEAAEDVDHRHLRSSPSFVTIVRARRSWSDSGCWATTTAPGSAAGSDRSRMCLTQPVPWGHDTTVTGPSRSGPRSRSAS
jgi:hypothetical protein